MLYGCHYKMPHLTHFFLFFLHTCFTIHVIRIDSIKFHLNNYKQTKRSNENPIANWLSWRFTFSSLLSCFPFWQIPNGSMKSVSFSIYHIWQRKNMAHGNQRVCEHRTLHYIRHIELWIDCSRFDNANPSDVSYIFCTTKWCFVNGHASIVSLTFVYQKNQTSTALDGEHILSMCKHFTESNKLFT